MSVMLAVAGIMVTVFSMMSGRVLITLMATVTRITAERGDDGEINADADACRDGVLL